MDITIGSILKRRRKDILFKVVSFDNLYTKIIRIDDYEHRSKQKEELLNNHIFNMIYKVIQKKILNGLDEPQYVNILTNKLHLYFTIIE